MGSLNGVKKTGNWLVFYLSIVSGSILAAIAIGWLSYDLVSRQLHLAAANANEPSDVNARV
ncbi:hypothetical protein QY884_11665 [Latilactobacillus sakei]